MSLFEPRSFVELSRRPWRNSAIVAVFATLTFSPASAQEAASAKACTLEADKLERLACYDAIYMSDEVSSPTSGIAWHSRVSTSPIDDSREVFLTVRSKSQVPGRYRDNDFAQLSLRCTENTTAATIYFGGEFVADSGSYGEITYRVDDQPAVTRSFEASTSNEHLGLWNGGSSIPFIKSLFEGQNLIVRATPYNENPVVLEFDISGTEEAVEELRSICGW